MEKSIAKPSSPKPSTSNEVTTSLLHGEKSPSSDVSTAKSPEKLENKVTTKEADIPIAPARYESLGTDVVSQDDEDEEDEIKLCLQSSDEDIFEDTVEDVSELIKNKTSAVETYFSDIESSDNSQVYEPKSKGATSVEAIKTVSNVCKVIGPKGLDKEKGALDFEPVESEEDFEESRSQEEVPIVLQMEEDSCGIETKSQVEEESNGTPEAGLIATLSSDKEDSELNEANKESSSITDELLEKGKNAPIESEQETPTVDAESYDTPETDIPPASPAKSLKSMEASNDSLPPFETHEILPSEPEPAQKDKKVSQETEKNDEMEVDTDIPSLDVTDKVSVEVYEASNESMNEMVESQEVMEVASNEKHIAVGDDDKSQAQTSDKSLSEKEELITENKPSNSQETVEKSAKAPEASNEEEKEAPEHNDIVEGPIQSLTSLENADISVGVQVPTETSIESSNAAEKSEAIPDLTSMEPPTSSSNAAAVSEATTVTSSSEAKGPEASTEHSTGNQKLVKETEKLLETDTKSLEIHQKSQVTVDVVEKSETNQQLVTEAQEPLSKLDKTPNTGETSADDTSKKGDSIEDAPTLETAENSTQKGEEDVSLAAVKNLSEITTNAEKSVDAIKSPEMEQIEEDLTSTATSSDILMDTHENSAKAIDTNQKDSTVVDELPHKPEKSLDTSDEESNKAQEHISESGKAAQSALDGNVDDSTKNDRSVDSADEKSKKADERTTDSDRTLESAQNLGGNEEDSTGVDEELDTDKSPSKSAVDSEKSIELNEKSHEEKSLENPIEVETNSSEKPSKCDDEASTESVAFSIGKSAQDEGEAKVSKPEDAADIQKVVAEEGPADSEKPLAVSDLSKEENDAKQPPSIDPEIIEIDDDDLEDNKTIEHATASGTKPAPIEAKEDDPPGEVVTEELQHDKFLPGAAVPIEKPTEKAEGSTEKPSNSAEAEKDIKSAVEQEIIEIKAPETASAQAPPDDDESLLVIDTSHKEDNEPDDNDMDTETEQTATSAPTTTDSSSEGSLEIFYDKECVHYECKRGSKNFYRATLFTLNYYKISKKRNKAQYVCEECYDRALNSYEEMCKTLTKKQPLLHGATFKDQEFVEIIDSSEEDDDHDAGDSFKDENVLPKDSIELLEAELEGAIRKVMHNVDIQNQLSWTKQILQQRLNNLQEDTEFVSVQLRQLQKKADNMHNSLYQCPKIKIRQLTPLDLNSGRTYNPETESTIPPMGEVLRTSINVNETYYAVKNKAIASWVPCKVIEAIDNYSPYSKNQKHFKIKFLKSKYPMLKTVSAKHMAFFNPPKVRLPIGTRVIAYFDVTSLSRGKEKMLIPSAFYPGIIAEPLKQSNKFRYLVFYDDGYFQYVYHKDVRLVCQASENVWEDVHHQSREFIHNYLTQYAVNRPMVQTQKGQSMLVDYNGKWIYARVIDVDCSLVQMLFEGQSRSEWIYRGSTRLGPVYKESNSLVQTSTSRISRRTEPFIRYINGDDSSSSQQSQEQPAQPSQPKAGEVRSVAKKSVSKTDNSHQSNQPVPTVRHLNNSTIFVDDDNKPKGKVVYYTARKNLPPRDYEPHICSPTCPFNVTHNLSFYSPLAKPLLSGWERQVFRQKSKKFIVYRGPCGKRLRSMEELHRYLRVTENELNVDNFDFSAETNCLAEYVIESCIVQKKDISNGKEKMPIPCVNYYDNTMPPDCIYSSRRIPTEGVPLNLDKDFLVGCDCEDDCSDKSKCSCWELTYAGAKYGMPNVPNEMVGYQYKRLYEHVPTGIYECNARCKCKANCVNRVVQQPLQSKLQVFKTSNRGWGLRCINDVPRGSFICIYAGHLLNEQKANEGGLDAGDEYFAELDYIEVAEQIKEGYESDIVEPDEDEDLYNPDKEDEDDDEFVVPGESHRNKSFNTRSRSRRSTKNSSDVEHDSQERQVISFEPNKTMGQPDNSASEKPTIRKLFGKDEACYIMDAKITGNLGRYFNHSCSPNLFVQNVFVDTHDLRFPWVAFFAFTHIRAGTELTWNYNYEVGVVPGKVLYCQCGAPNCRQRLL